jgi:hypothetical protein
MLPHWADQVTQVAEHLPSKCKALSLNLNTGKKKSAATNICMYFFWYIVKREITG